MNRAATRRAVRHVLTRVRPDEREQVQEGAPVSDWSDAHVRRFSPGERWMGPVFAGPESDPVWIRERTWQSHPAAVAQARALTWAAMADWNLLELTDEAMLCVSELATNAVVHPLMPDQLVRLGTTFTVRLLFWPKRAVAIEVRDSDPRLPVMPGRHVLEPSSSEPDRIGKSLRGLRMVEAASDLLHWGPWAMGGKTVWCRFDLEPRGLARPFRMTGTP